MSDWWRRSDGMKWTALGSFCGLILCPSGICSFELKPSQLWKQIKLSPQRESLMSANSVFAVFIAIKCLMSLWDYYQNGTVAWKVRHLLSLMQSHSMLLSPVSVLFSDCDAWDMIYRLSRLTVWSTLKYVKEKVAKCISMILTPADTLTWSTLHRWPVTDY